MTGTSARTVDLGPGRSVAVTLGEAGAGRTALILHGGGGPVTVQSIADHLSRTMRVLVPVHPRLSRVEIPVLVLWGDSDRIVTPGYGQGLAAAFPQAQFTIIDEAGHLPQIEQPAATFGALDAYISKNAGRLPRLRQPHAMYQTILIARDQGVADDGESEKAAG